MNPVEYDYGFTLAAFMLALLCALFTVHHSETDIVRRRQRALFRVILASVTLTPLFSFISTYIELLGDAHRFFTVMYLTQLGLFVTHHAAAPFFVLYTMSLNGHIRGLKRLIQIALMIPFVLIELAVLTNPIHHGLFYYNGDLRYTRGDWMLPLYFIALFYYALGIVQMLRSRKVLRHVRWSYLLFCYLMVLTGIAIQLFYPHIRVEYFTESLMAMILMVAFERDMHTISPLTGLFNRIGFAEDIRINELAGRHYTLIAIRLRDLKDYARILGETRYRALVKSVALGLSQSRVSNLDEGAYSYDEDSLALLLYGSEAKAEKRRDEVLEKLRGSWSIPGGGAIQLQATVAEIHVPKQISDRKLIMGRLSDPEPLRPEGVTLLGTEEIEHFERAQKVEIALRRALQENRLQVWFQPIWNVHEQRFTSAEALSRLIDDELGSVPPSEFIPIAEQRGLMGQLGDFVLDKTCAMAASGVVGEGGLAYLHVNVSPYQLPGENLAERFNAILARYGIGPERLRLEITETMDVDNSALVRQSVSQLREAGFQFAMDDFGTGFSNLSSLLSGRFADIKLDRSLLLSAERDHGRQMLRSIYEMVRASGLITVQEGVETEEQLHLVEGFGCDTVQGFYFARPMPPEDFTAFLQENRTTDVPMKT